MSQRPPPSHNSVRVLSAQRKANARAEVRNIVKVPSVMTTPIRATNTVLRKELVGGDIDHQTVLVGVDGGCYYGLDEIGSRIWGLIAQPRRVCDLTDMLTAEFEVTREQCETDVLSYLTTLAEHQLIEISP